MFELLISLGFAISLLLTAAGWMMHKTDKEMALLQAALRGAKLALETTLDDRDEMRTAFEERAIKAAARYHAGTMRYEEAVSAANARWISATKQNANLAEQLATIRLAHPEAYSESEEHIEDVSPSIPYSVELADWFSKFESPQSREIAMEQADMYRESGLDDAQIIDKLEEEWLA